MFDPLQASFGGILLPIVLNYHLFFKDFLSQKREYLINFIQYVACNKVTLSDSFTRHEIDNFFREIKNLSTHNIPLNLDENIPNNNLRGVIYYLESLKINEFIALKKNSNKELVINPINTILNKILGVNIPYILLFSTLLFSDIKVQRVKSAQLRSNNGGFASTSRSSQ